MADASPAYELCDQLFEGELVITLFDVVDWFFREEPLNAVKSVKAMLHEGHVELIQADTKEPVSERWQWREILKAIADGEPSKELCVRATDRGHKWWRSYVSGES